MILGKTDNLFPPKIRKNLMVALIIAGFLFFLLVRFSESGVLKITWLYAMYACIMLLTVLCKNSLNKYEVAVFCFLCVQLFTVVPPVYRIDNLVGTSYLLSYRYGISSRSFIATIIDFFTRGGFISRFFIWHFIFISTVFFSFIISVCLGTIIHKAEDDTKFFLILVSLFYLSCFTAPVAYFTTYNFGRVEIFAIPVLFFIMIIIKKPVIRWLIPLLTIIVMATHFILVFFYIPLIIILLFYCIFEKTERNKQAVFLLIVTVTALLTVFLCYLLFGRRTFVFEDARSFYEYIIERTDLNFAEDLLHFTLFASLEDHLTSWRKIVNPAFLGSTSVLINIPIIFSFVFFWIMCFGEETEKPKKLFFLMPILVLLYQAVAFFMFFDFGRWIIMVLNVQFMLFFYLVFVKNKTVLSVIEAIAPIAKRYGFFIALICLIMMFFGPVANVAPSENILRLFNFGNHLKL